jgi:hypothetical protein
VHASKLEGRIGHFEQMVVRELRRGLDSELISLRKSA